MTHYPDTTPCEPASKFGQRVSELQDAAGFAHKLAILLEDVEHRVLGPRGDDQNCDRPSLGGGSLNDDIQMYVDAIDRHLGRISSSTNRLDDALRGVPFEQSPQSDITACESYISRVDDRRDYMRSPKE